MAELALLLQLKRANERKYISLAQMQANTPPKTYELALEFNFQSFFLYFDLSQITQSYHVNTRFYARNYFDFLVSKPIQWTNQTIVHACYASLKIAVKNYENQTQFEWLNAQLADKHAGKTEFFSNLNYLEWLAISELDNPYPTTPFDYVEVYSTMMPWLLTPARVKELEIFIIVATFEVALNNYTAEEIFLGCLQAYLAVRNKSFGEKQQAQLEELFQQHPKSVGIKVKLLADMEMSGGSSAN